jgi:hypothetical protein
MDNFGKYDSSSLPEINDVDVGAEPGVISQIVAGVVGIFVDDNLVASPVPIRAKSDIRVGHTEVESVEPETRRPTAGQTPDVTRPEASGEVSVRPGMVYMIAGVVRPLVVPYPVIVPFDVRRVWMTWGVPEVSVSRRGMLIMSNRRRRVLVMRRRRRRMMRFRSVRRNVASSWCWAGVPSVFLIVLRKGNCGSQPNRGRQDCECLGHLCS